MNTIPVKFILSKRTFYITSEFTSDTFKIQVWDGKSFWVGEGLFELSNFINFKPMKMYFLQLFQMACRNQLILTL